MKFKLVKPGCVDSRAYGLEGISTGDVVEFHGHFVEKASRNPDFEEVKDSPSRAKPKKTAKKKAVKRGK